MGKAFERFSEDGLRVLRAARFCATLEFELDPETFAAIAPTLDTFRKVSAERVRDEWVKTMKAKTPVARVRGDAHVGHPRRHVPRAARGRRHGAEQVALLRRVDARAWRAWTPAPAIPILRIAALLHDVGKPRSRAFSDKTKDYTFYDHDKIGAEIALPIATRLRFSNDERDRIVALVRHHLFHYDAWSDQAVRRWIKRVGPERLEDLYALNEADLRGKGPIFGEGDLAPLFALKAHVEKVLAEGAALSTRDLAIDGNDPHEGARPRAGTHHRTGPRGAPRGGHRRPDAERARGPARARP